MDKKAEVVFDVFKEIFYTMDTLSLLVQISTLYGWINLTCGRDSLVKTSVEYFDKPFR